MSPIWYFEDINLYDILCPHKVSAMGKKHEFKEYKKDEFVYFSNDPSNKIYLIAKGRIRITSSNDNGDVVIKAILGEGELFGEMALIGQTNRSDFAQAIENGTLLCPMRVNDLEELMAVNKKLNFQIYKIIGFRLQRLERKIESLMFKDARTRIVEFLHDWALEKGQPVGYEIKIRNYLTHKDIANLTGTSRQTVTILLNEMKEKNIINFDRRQFLIRDMNLLKQQITKQE